MTTVSRNVLTFVVVVLFPVVVGAGVGALFLEQAEAGVQIRSDVRMARAASLFLSRELMVARDSLAPRAEPAEAPDPPTPALRQAQAGDTVLAIAAEEHGLRVTVLFVDSTGLRAAAGRIPADFVTAFESVTTYGLSIYLHDRRVASGGPPLGPERLPPGLVEESRRTGDPVQMAAEQGPAILVRLAGQAGSGNELAVLVGETEPQDAGSPLLPTLPVLAMVLLLSLAAAWSVEARAEHGSERPSPALVQSVLVALLPVLAGAALLAALGQHHARHVERAVMSDLARASALLKVSGQGASIEAARDLGFDAALLAGGSVSASTLVDEVARANVARIAPPPPTFSATGRLNGEGGPLAYIASRARNGTVLVLLARAPEEEAAAFRIRLLAPGLLMVGPALLYLAFLALSGPAWREVSPK